MVGPNGPNSDSVWLKGRVVLILIRFSPIDRQTRFGLFNFAFYYKQKSTTSFEIDVKSLNIFGFKLRLIE